MDRHFFKRKGFESDLSDVTNGIIAKVRKDFAEMDKYKLEI